MTPYMDINTKSSEEERDQIMGSLGEEMFAMDKDCSGVPQKEPSVLPESSEPALTCTQLSLREVLGKQAEAEAEIQQRIMRCLDRRGINTEGNQMKESLMELVAELRRDGYEASLCRQAFRYAENYEYIEVMVVENGSDGFRGKSRIIVDLDFRSQFELAKSTVSYQKLTQMLPLKFVGTEEKLKKVIPLICSALKSALKEKGMYRPPWRKRSYMQSKWLSKNCKRISGEGEVTDWTINSCCPSIF